MNRFSGKAWAELLNVTVLDPTGWDDQNHFENGLITKAEFCNRAANSKLKTHIAATRREASVMLQKDFKKNFNELPPTASAKRSQTQ